MTDTETGFETDEETEEGTGTLHQLATLLGEGWTAQPFAGRDNDGKLTGPGGEVFFCDLRSYQYGASNFKPNLYLRLRLWPAGAVTRVDGDGLSLEDFAARVKEAYPSLAAAHAESLRLIAERLAVPRAFAEQVATYMPEGWTGGAEDAHRGDRFEPRAYLTDGKHRIVWVWAGEFYPPWPARAELRDYDRFTIYGEKDSGTSLWDITNGRDEIGVSAKHTAKRVAGEITRRLLPAYLAAYQKAEERDAFNVTAEASLDAVCAALTKEAPKLSLRRAPKGHTAKGTYYFTDEPGDPSRATVEASHSYQGAKVNVELYDLPPALAAKVLKLVGKG